MYSSTDGTGTTLTTGGTGFSTATELNNTSRLFDGGISTTDFANRITITLVNQVAGYQFAAATLVRSFRIYSLGSPHGYSLGFVIESSPNGTTWTQAGATTYAHDGTGWNTFTL